MSYVAVVEGEQRSGDTELVGQLHHLLRVQSRLSRRAAPHAAVIAHLLIVLLPPARRPGAGPGRRRPWARTDGRNWRTGRTGFTPRRTAGW